MINAIERRIGFFRETPQRAQAREERAAANAEKARKKREEEIQRIIGDKTSGAVILLIENLENHGVSSLRSLQNSEAEFQTTIEEIEEKVAEKYSTTNEEREYNSRFTAFKANRSLRFHLDGAHPPKAEASPSLKRCMRAVVAWSLIRTEELSGDVRDMSWAVGFLGKVLNNNVTDADWKEFLEAPPKVPVPSAT